MHFTKLSSSQILIAQFLHPRSAKSRALLQLLSKKLKLQHRKVDIASFTLLNRAFQVTCFWGVHVKSSYGKLAILKWLSSWTSWIPCWLNNCRACQNPAKWASRQHWPTITSTLAATKFTLRSLITATFTATFTLEQGNWGGFHIRRCTFGSISDENFAA